ncbi:FixH family protein [Saccharicrinis sp. 156]|uniref:FixH family protein n=1 Tax=Saccharicrinis sp. 156 TaxID=3417574 RepID=UPI003D34174F
MKFNWGHGIIVFFVIFFTWIISFVIFTLGENNDLVTKDYYRQGAEYSLTMDINKRSAIYRDSISIVNVEDGVVIELASSVANLPKGKDVYFYRPSGKKDDVKLWLDQGKKELFVPNSKLIKGRYNVSVSWNESDNKYKVSKDFVVR